jgi:tetratricopeptide (TPR) repeat protein
LLAGPAGRILTPIMKRSAAEYALPALPVLALALILFHSSLWLPGAVFPWTPAVVLGLALVWLAADRSVVAGAGVAMALLLLCALLARPEVHLWGDGALRLRNLEAGLPIAQSARFQPGDALLHRLAAAAGFGPEGSFAAVGAVGGALYLAGAVMVVRSAGCGRHAAGALTVLAVSPAWMVFFTGYVESYALLAGLLALFTGLVMSGRSPFGASLCALAASSVHLLGVLLVPGVLLYSIRGRSALGVASGLAAAAAVTVWLLATGSSGGVPSPAGLLVPGPLQRLGLAAFAAPALLMMLPFVRRGAGPVPLLCSAVWLAAFLLFPLERGAARDWDLGAVMLVPAYLTAAAASAGRRGPLVAVAAAAVILSGPRLASFLDPRVSLARYELSVEESSDPSALEELGIARRDAERYDEAAELFARAFSLSGNGRHLSQQAEALRLAGRPQEAAGPALLATELRPDVETVWLQLALVARDLDDPELAMKAAEGHQELFPDSPGLWYLALEACVPGGEPRYAWICAERALAGGDTLFSGLINAGTAAWMNGFTGLAMERYLRAADMDPSSPLPWYNMGMVMLDSGDGESAVYYMGRALDADSGFAPAGEVLDLLE